MENFSDNMSNQIDTLEMEAERFCLDISYGVKYVKISDKLEKNSSVVHINISTLENENWCIELNNHGFIIVSNSFDSIDNTPEPNYISNKKKKFETIESLMFTISPMFSQKFNEMVSKKLNEMVSKKLNEMN